MFGEINDAEVRARAEEAGIRWVRLVASWASGNLDGMVENAINAGLEPIIVLGSSPHWATEDVAVANGGTHYGCGPIDDEDLPAFADHIRRLAERYDGDGDYDGDGVVDGPAMPEVTRWEFWNEPDNQSTSEACIYVGGCWGGDLDGDGIPDPREYVTMLSYAYPAVKEGNPNAKVLLGAVAHEVIDADCFNMSFLDDVLNYGGGQYFDLMNFHQYDFKRGEWNGPLPYDQGILGKSRAMKDKLAEYGLDKPLVISEIGFAVRERTPEEKQEWEEYQARVLVQEFVRGMSWWPDKIKAIIWFLMVDEVPPNPSGEFGLLQEETLEPRPSYYAYQQLTRELEGARFERQLSPEETGSVNIQAYRFVMEDGMKKLVLFRDDGRRLRWQGLTAEENMDVGGEELGEWTGRVEVRDKFGNEMVIQDGGENDEDGVINGTVRLSFTSSPIYVMAVP